LNLGSIAAASSRNNLHVCSHSIYLKQHTNQVHGE
jgi:hypothetical protein